jgi:serine protease Do
MVSRGFGYGLVLLAATGAWCIQAKASGGRPSGSGSGAPSAHSAQGYLGVDVRDVSGDQMAALKLKEPHGAEIIVVDHDAPAGKAGLHEHDVVLQMNGQAIEGEDQIRRMLHECSPGKTVVLVISRDGQQMTITTQMGNREEVERKAWEQHITVHEPASQADNGFAAGTSSQGTPVHGGSSFIGTILMIPSYTGATLEPINGQLAQYFGAATGKGLLVRSVAANSPAALAGMQTGDVVVRADTKPVTSPSDWSKAIKNCKGHSMTVIVLREKKEQTLTLTPDAKKRSSLEQPTDNPGRNVVAHMGFSWMSHVSHGHLYL